MSTNKAIIEVYKSLYDLPELTHIEKASFEFFRLCKENYNFVIISIYNERREFLLARDFNKNIGWELIGGYIETSERIEDAINRIVLREVGLTIDEVQPIAILNNKFECNGRVIEQSGIALAALVRGQVKLSPPNVKIIYTKEIPEFMAYQDKRILQLAKEIITNSPFEPPYEEIESGKKFFLFHIINKYLVKIIGNFASKKIQNKILSLVFNNPKSIIDVSCGDDELVFKLEKEYCPEICIGNDISWKILSLSKNTRKSNIIFTNHSVLTLPFSKKFDLMIFKNTLHHITPSEQINLIKKLSNISRQLIIVDVEDPNQSNFLSRIWHWYYSYFLGDQGSFFLTLRKFKETIEDNIRNKKTIFGTINTIKGKYFYVSLLDSIQSEEVATKIKISPSQIKSIKSSLLAMGAAKKEKINENDSYFSATNRDFIKTKEYLLIRKRDDYLELTFKGPAKKLMNKEKQFGTSEVNISLDCAKEDVELLLQSIDFKKIIEVTNIRERFILNNQEINIDNVKNLGWFLEIKNNIINKEEKGKALSDNINLLKRLNFNAKNIINDPYCNLVLEKKEEN